MKLLILLLVIPIFGISQKLGSWKLPDGSVITRINDTTQIEYKGGRTDTFSVTWLTEKTYSIKSKNCPIIFVRIIRITTTGYCAMVYDRRGKTKYFEAFKL